jgi:hypothetical protein
MNIRVFELSCKNFSGFSHRVDLDEHDSLDSIIIEILENLKNILKSHGLHFLSNKIQNSDYHVHDYTFADVLMNDKRFYICNHCETIHLKI